MDIELYDAIEYALFIDGFELESEAMEQGANRSPRLRREIISDIAQWSNAPWIHRLCNVDSHADGVMLLATVEAYLGTRELTSQLQLHPTQS